MIACNHHSVLSVVGRTFSSSTRAIMPHETPRRSYITLLCFLAFPIVLGGSQEVPHVDACNFCKECHVDVLPPSDSSLDGPVEASALHPDLFTALKPNILMKQLLPNCTVCRGCNTKLTPMAAKIVQFNVTYTPETGASPYWIFKAVSPMADTAVVKVACVPIKKQPTSEPPVCTPSALMKQNKVLLALDKLSGECGFTDIVPRVRVARVNAVTPQHGFHVRWHGLWMGLAQGVSMDSLMHGGLPKPVPPGNLVDIMHTKLNHTQVVLAAIFDLLTCQCDRHAQNVLISESGQISLIDNDWALQHSADIPAFNSIFLPTSQKQEIVRLDDPFISKLTRSVFDMEKADPQLLLDYRCYLPDGKAELGTDYPPRVKECLRRISNMTQQQVEQHYEIDPVPAHNLLTRATDMITNGFEWTIKFGKPRNPAPMRYLVQPKCCKLKINPRWSQSNALPRWLCAHDYKPVDKLPYGDPLTGQPWSKPIPDPGSFDGNANLVGME